MKKKFIVAMTVEEFMALEKKNRPDNLYIRMSGCCMEVCEGNVKRSKDPVPLEDISLNHRNDNLTAWTVRHGCFFVDNENLLYKTTNREKVYHKYGGRCAYCGRKIEIKAMHVDHYWPQHLAHFYPRLDNNREENLMPSCRKCNSCKGGLRPKAFRKELSLQVKRLRKNAQFERALRFGQVTINERPIVFYFERKQSEDHLEDVCGGK